MRFYDVRSIPTIVGVFGKNPALCNALVRTFGTSFVPIPILTHEEIMRLPHLGIHMADHTAYYLKEREIPQRHLENPILFIPKLFGSVEAARADVLHVARQSAGYTTHTFNPLPIVQKILTIKPGTKIADLASMRREDVKNLVNARFSLPSGQLDSEVDALEARMAEFNQTFKSPAPVKTPQHR